MKTVCLLHLIQVNRNIIIISLLLILLYKFIIIPKSFNNFPIFKIICSWPLSLIRLKCTLKYITISKSINTFSIYSSMTPSFKLYLKQFLTRLHTNPHSQNAKSLFPLFHHSLIHLDIYLYLHTYILPLRDVFLPSIHHNISLHYYIKTLLAHFFNLKVINPHNTSFLHSDY